MRESKLRNSAMRGISSAVMSAVFFLLIPVLYFHYVVPYAADYADLTAVSELMERWFLCGTVLVVLAFPRGYFAVGNVKRVYAWTVSAAMSIIWLLYVTEMGDLSGILTITGEPEIYIGASVLGLIVIAAVLKLFKLVIVLCDHRDYRGEFSGNSREETDGKPARESIRVRGKYD